MCSIEMAEFSEVWQFPEVYTPQVVPQSNVLPLTGSSTCSSSNHGPLSPTGYYSYFDGSVFTDTSSSFMNEMNSIESVTSNTASYLEDFSVSMDSSDGSRKFIQTADKEKHLIIKKDVNFALSFSSDTPLPPNGLIRALLTSAAVNPLLCCKADITEDYLGNRFMVCCTEGAKYTEWKGQHSIDILVSDLPETSCKPFAVFKFRCQSSHLPRLHSKLTLEFYLFERNTTAPIGYDSISVKITPCIGRESKKLLSILKPIPAAFPPSSRKQKLTATTPSDADTPAVPPLPEGVLDFTAENPPDKDGYYHFSWSGKDKLIFNLLTAIKKSSEID
ncbi:PREDICTED: uncharacterized protein LOC100631617 isoform X2 [Amphimedon queenslandica]|uniref:p53 DNA-binding domain-containing protein n=1 Tax=Amphimedon queenslandica TaxID=400682 RepID=A0AAN0J883_AMPQE|nr:PREDICTED: uncharacterized protein LOC100631617 isoform X2 [Amphimedon queenslandica]|eukprot:XP_019852941.1 PREDICTED: uncharacterized protein LOC100631617 isoform X2 [Amphimedon queenslandica]